MNLHEAHQSALDMSLPQHGHYRGVAIDESTWAGIDSNGLPVLLIRHPAGQKMPAITRKHLSVLFDVPCSIRSMGSDDVVGTFCVIAFSERGSASVAFFWSVCNALLATLDAEIVARDIFDAAVGIANILAKLEEPASGTVLGLVGELIFVLASDDAERWVRAWRQDPEESWDFYESGLVVDAKATTKANRVHEVSFLQANPPGHLRGLFASVLITRAANGADVVDLIDLVSARLHGSPELSAKVFSVASATLGVGLADSRLRLDVQSSIESLRIYRAHEIPGIRGNLPDGVLGARWTSDFGRVSGCEFAQVAEFA